MQGKISLILRAMRKYSDNSPAIGFSSPFQVLISTVLSQRTRDSNTAKASAQLFAEFPDSKKLSKANTKKIEGLIKPAGFYRVKAERIKQIAEQLEKEFQGKVPKTRKQLLSIKGVGPKTAGCVIVYAFKGAELPVDTHVHRISNRLGLVKTKTPEKTEPALKKIIPKKYWAEINHLMVRYGQKICLSKNPRCNACDLRKICAYYKTIAKKQHSS